MNWLALYLTIGILGQSYFLSVVSGNVFDKYKRWVKFQGIVLIVILWPIALIAFFWVCVLDYLQWRKTHS